MGRFDRYNMVSKHESREYATEGRCHVKLIGVLLLLFVAVVGIVFCAGALDGPEFETVADYSFEIPAAELVGNELERVAEWVCPCCRCVHRGRVIRRYECEPIRLRATALALEGDRLILPRSISPATNQVREPQTGRFAGDRA